MLNIQTLLVSPFSDWMVPVREQECIHIRLMYIDFFFLLPSYVSVIINQYQSIDFQC